jgi:asparagine synthetase A
VWFGWKPHWITAKPIEDNETDPDDSEIGTDSDLESNANSNDNDNALSEIEIRVAAHNARLNAQMIKANNRRSEKFTDGMVATLQIPLKLQLAIESSRLPVRVLELKNS